MWLLAFELVDFGERQFTMIYGINTPQYFRFKWILLLCVLCLLSSNSTKVLHPFLQNILLTWCENFPSMCKYQSLKISLPFYLATLCRSYNVRNTIFDN